MEKQLLLQRLQRSPRIYTLLRHRRGLRREISLIVIDDNRPWNITTAAVTVLNMKLGWRDGIVVKGAGMDLGFWLVHELATKLGISLEHHWI